MIRISVSLFFLLGSLCSVGQTDSAQKQLISLRFAAGSGGYYPVDRWQDTGYKNSDGAVGAEFQVGLKVQGITKGRNFCFFDIDYQASFYHLLFTESDGGQAYHYSNVHDYTALDQGVGFSFMVNHACGKNKKGYFAIGPCLDISICRTKNGRLVTASSGILSYSKKTETLTNKTDKMVEPYPGLEISAGGSIHTGKREMVIGIHLKHYSLPHQLLFKSQVLVSVAFPLKVVELNGN